MKLHFFGAARSVTGSCIYIETGSTKALVDCGLYQGNNSHFINSRPFPFNPAEIEYLFLTHAHIDHSGLIPKLVREGFKGRIITTPATADLTELMLYDAAHIQESDAETETRRSLRAGSGPVYPIYTVEDVRESLRFFHKVPYKKLEHAGRGIKYRFRDAGHILGSSIIEIWFQEGPEEKKIVFSGDIGRKGNPIVRDPEKIDEADYVVVESTYGNRRHKGLRETIDEFIEAIKATFKKGGNVLIPAFSVGRTQDILYILNNLVHEGRLYNINVYVDSPLAEEATKAYIAHPECFDEDAMERLKKGVSGDAIKLRFTESVNDSMALNKIKSHAIIIAGSGMCEGGRIRHHLKHNLWRPQCSIIFVGFQAKGTLGRKILDGAPVVRIFGEDIAVKARVYTLGGFSAHADQAELLEWLSSFDTKPLTFINHGESETSFIFSRIVKERLGLEAIIPEEGEGFEL
ncbi:MAG: MBL fold metallo-hydrolase RNA specificity domain-containing protein [Thermodesulfovibrionales bacterium]